MFCYQCEQTSKGEGCTKIGVCGKTAEVAALQDLLIYGLKGLSLVAVEARKRKIDLSEVDRFTLEATFSTLTNVDFDPARFVELIARCAKLRDGLKQKVKAAGGPADFGHDAAAFAPAGSAEALIDMAERAGVKAPAADADAQALRELLTYGLKGVAAYADHARILGQEDEAVYAFVHEAFAATLNPKMAVGDYLGLVLKCGEVNLKVMELLDAANTGTYGHPVPTTVPRRAGQGQGHPRLRPRPEGPRGAAQADRGQGHQRLHPRRDAARARLSRAEEVQAPGRQLRRRVAGPGEGVRRVPRRDPDDDQLHPEADGQLQGPHLHQRAGRLAGRAAHRRPRLRAGDRQGRSPARVRRRRGRRRPSRSASAATPCWAWRARSSTRSRPARSGTSS